MKKTLLAMFVCFAILFCAMPALAAKSDDATLDAVIVNDKDITIQRNMTVTIPMNSDEVDLVFETSDSDAEMEITTDKNCTYSERKELLTLDDKADSYTITIEVTAEDGDTFKTYTLKLKRGNSELLDNLKVYGADDDDLLNGEFESDEYEYDIYIRANDDTSALALMLEPVEDDVDVTINGSVVKAKYWDDYEIQLNAKVTEIKIELEYEDEYALYVLNVEREQSDYGNSALDDLLVSEEKSKGEALDIYPEFDPEIDTYYVFLADGITDIYVRADAADRDYDVYIDDNTSVNSDGNWEGLSINKNGEKHVITVEEDDDLVGTYTLYFYLGDSNDNTDKDLDSLKVKYQSSSSKWEDVELNPEFVYSHEDYSATIPENNYDKVRIYAESFDSKAYVLINNKLLTDDYLETYLSAGKSEYDILVIAENCKDMAEYTLTLNYGSSKTSLGLDGLKVKVYNGSEAALNPTFATDRLNYTLNLSNSAQYVSFYPETDNKNALVYISGYKRDANDWSYYLTLAEGLNTFKVTVYNGSTSGASTVYTVTIYRQPANLSTKVSKQSVTVDGRSVDLKAYNINGNNFVKLRDVAYVLNGTAAQFGVSFDSASNRISLTPNTAYVSNGQENTALSTPKAVVASSQSLYISGKLVTPMAYNIDGNNFVMLRDLGLLLDFNVGYNKTTDTVQINTTQGYTAE